MLSVCNNYGTFDPVKRSPEEGDTASYTCDRGQEGSKTEHRLLRDWEGRFGLRLRKDGVNVVISEVEDEVARARGLCEGYVVTHMDGRPVLGSLQNTVECFEQAGNCLILRVQSTGSNRTRLDSALVNPRDNVVHHTVRQGDAVEALAVLYGVTPQQIRVWNRKHFPIGESGALVVGHVITLHTSTVGHTRSPKKVVAQGRPEELSNSTARRRKSETDDRRRQMLYVVREGDTLKTISTRLNVREQEVRVLNRSVFPLGEPGALLPGQTLRIFAVEGEGLIEDGNGWSTTEEECVQKLISNSTARRRKSETDDGRRRMLYVVREGDTLKTISTRLNVKEQEVRVLNRSVFPVGEPGALVPGQTLRIFAVEGEGLIEDGNGWSTTEEECEQELIKVFASRKKMGMWIRPTAVVGY